MLIYCVKLDHVLYSINYGILNLLSIKYSVCMHEGVKFLICAEVNHAPGS